MAIAADLDRALRRQNIPILGVRVPVDGDRTTWRVDYLPAATAPQRQTGDALLLSYDPAVDSAKVTEDAQADLDAKAVKALAIWTAQRLSVPLATMRAEVLQIYKGL